jgi:hypothetical protein
MWVFFVAIWYILRPVGKFCGRLVYFMVIWYIFPSLVCCTQKNVATLFWIRQSLTLDQQWLPDLFLDVAEMRNHFYLLLLKTDAQRLNSICPSNDFSQHLL